MVTCCPACGTMFRVVPDQLKISEGWVRCGHCAEVFDATANMMADTPPPLEADTLPPDAVDDANLQAPRATLPPAAPPPSVPPATPEPQPARAAAADVAADSEAPESALDQPFVFRRSDMGAGDSLPSVTPPVAESRPALDAPSSILPDDELAEDVSFMRQARRDAFWRRPLVRVLLAVVALVLGAALALQYALHDRDRLAAAQPELRPWLEQLCELAACRIAPPRQIETIAIDSSSFNKLRTDAYRLNFTLKNNAGTVVATPAMELTLTDAQDQPVVRRVLTGSDFASPPPTLPPGGDWTASVTLTVNQPPQTARIAGYRLLAFYP